MPSQKQTDLRRRTILVKKTLTLATMLAMAVMVALMGGTVAAQQSGASASRSFDNATVGPGEEVEVTIQASGYGFGGQVVETLPDGFTYVEDSASPSSLRVDMDGQELRFTLLGETGFSYKVAASSDAGEYTFMGVLKYSPATVIVDVEVSGPGVVTVEAAQQPTDDMAMASRSISPATVDAGGEVEVTIQASGYGFGGQVVETLPAGFSYVNGSVNPSNINVREEDQDLKFTLLGEPSFSYKVTASSDAGEYSFMGVLKYSPVDVIVDVGVGGASAVTVEAAAPPPTATWLWLAGPSVPPRSTPEARWR